MLSRSNRRRIGMAAVVLTLTAVLGAQTQQKPYEPVVGQEGKDAVWVPTSQAMVEKMLDHAKVTPQDFVMDLGSGDGRTIIAAAKRGARGLGVEFNADLVEYSQRQAAAPGVGDKAIVRPGRHVRGRHLEGDGAGAVPAADATSRSWCRSSSSCRRAPGSSPTRSGCSDWTPDDTLTLTEGVRELVHVAPLHHPGESRGQDGACGDGVVTLTQKYQMVEGTYTPATGAPAPVKGRMRGNVITVSLGPTEYEGTVNGNTMEGAAQSGSARDRRDENPVGGHSQRPTPRNLFEQRPWELEWRVEIRPSRDSVNPVAVLPDQLAEDLGRRRRLQHRERFARHALAGQPARGRVVGLRHAAAFARRRTSSRCRRSACPDGGAGSRAVNCGSRDSALLPELADRSP